MGFMKIVISDKELWYELDGPHGTEFIPYELFPGVPFYSGRMCPIPKGLRDYCDNSFMYSLQTKWGYGVRLSAPGYMDCTPWEVYDTLGEAEHAAAELEDDE